MWNNASRAGRISLVRLEYSRETLEREYIYINTREYMNILFVVIFSIYMIRQLFSTLRTY